MFANLLHWKCLLWITGIIGLSLMTGCGNMAKRQDTPPEISSVPKQESKRHSGAQKSYVVFGKRYYILNDSTNFSEEGIASWYGKDFHGRKTANGEIYNMYAMTAAHKNLPLPSYVEVTNLENNRTVIVKVNDRGPFHENRIIDLSYTAAHKLDIIKAGTALVRVRAITSDTEMTTHAQPTQHKARQFYIQVGAFSNLMNAQNMIQGLLNVSQLAKLSETVVNGQVLYRVRVGPLQEIKVADSIVSKLYQYGILDHHIVVE